MKGVTTKFLEQDHIDIGGSYREWKGESLTSRFETELMVQATPIVRKVILNPKVLVWCDHAGPSLSLMGILEAS